MCMRCQSAPYVSPVKLFLDSGRPLHLCPPRPSASSHAERAGRPGPRLRVRHGSSSRHAATRGPNLGLERPALGRSGDPSGCPRRAGPRLPQVWRCVCQELRLDERRSGGLLPSLFGLHGPPARSQGEGLRQRRLVPTRLDAAIDGEEWWHSKAHGGLLCSHERCGPPHASHVPADPGAEPLARRLAAVGRAA